MGGKQVKAKKADTKKKDTGEEQTETQTQQSTDNAVKNTEPPSSLTESKDNNNSDDIHPSWNDQALFSSNGQKVAKDDFELLTVIGKGSFGKVSFF